ncbi:MAG TPA: hypothetical protein VM073_07925 [Usitatibacter sp.]|nr:hypothetical protein [Usitatibacter sp.]
MARPLSLGLCAAVCAVLSLAACSETKPPRTGLVTPAEVHAFYESYPALFGARRVYSLREVVVSAPDLGATFTLPAEDVPLVLLPRLAAMQPGETVALSSPRGASVWQLVQFIEAPLSEREAAPLIEQFLAGHKRATVARYEVRS